jgi:hypothetical protein
MIIANRYAEINLDQEGAAIVSMGNNKRLSGIGTKQSTSRGAEEARKSTRQIASPRDQELPTKIVRLSQGNFSFMCSHTDMISASVKHIKTPEVYST